MFPDSFWSDIGPGSKLILAMLVFVVLPIMLALIKRLGAIRKTADMIEEKATAAANDADAAVRVAGKAVELSTPTGNGFAKHVRDELHAIRQEFAAHRQEYRDDMTGVRADIRDLAQNDRYLRDSDREQAKRLSWLEQLAERFHGEHRSSRREDKP